jgi:4-hydroxy-3-polyprenylbenzoate decarboxylase
MVIDRNHVAFHAVEGRHGSLIQQKYYTQRKVMPIALAFGDPALWWSTCTTLPWGVSEYDWAGGIKGRPIEVIEGPYTGLPIPADAEIVIEGEVHPDEFVDEGPFGEWHGYYGNLGLKPVPEPVIRIKAIHYRNDPILTCSQMTAPICEADLQSAITSSTSFWNQLEMLGFPGIKCVWCHEVGQGAFFNVISMKQMYAGHAQAIGVIASQFWGCGVGRYTILVDDDIDPTNLEEVIWAINTRVRPHEAIQIMNRCRSANHDPAIPIAEKEKYLIAPKPLYTSKAVINACQPFEHKGNWYPVAKVSPGLRAKIIDKWQSDISQFIRNG